ncbi:TrbC/VirB2 family protein [Variovorax sp. YR266]|uniref:TrbC/VirB2 family protein n=1 Tax=Variovorax sp. YR266 TaxID=1884386 RepID=UPI00210ADF60|nr:TrbC/VirB2 family protein [Variovorax sp. YR266]
MTACSIRSAALPLLLTEVRSDSVPVSRCPCVESVRLHADAFDVRGARHAPHPDPGKTARPSRAPIWNVNEVRNRTRGLAPLLIAVLAAVLPEVAMAGSPFATGANATQQQLVAILTPLAAVAVMVSGAMAWFGRLSWWWMVAVVIGTVLVFGGPQIVSWIRGLFGV